MLNEGAVTQFRQCFTGKTAGSIARWNESDGFHGTGLGAKKSDKVLCYIVLLIRSL